MNRPYIMVEDVKKPKKLLEWRSWTKLTKANNLKKKKTTKAPDHAAARVVKRYPKIPLLFKPSPDLFILIQNWVTDDWPNDFLVRDSMNNLLVKRHGLCISPLFPQKKYPRQDKNFCSSPTRFAWCHRLKMAVCDSLHVLLGLAWKSPAWDEFQSRTYLVLQKVHVSRRGCFKLPKVWVADISLRFSTCHW